MKQKICEYFSFWFYRLSDSCTYSVRSNYCLFTPQSNRFASLHIASFDRFPGPRFPRDLVKNSRVFRVIKIYVICGLSLLLVLVPAARAFLLVLQFSCLHKTLPIPNSTVDGRTTVWKPLKIPFIYYLFVCLCLVKVTDLRQQPSNRTQVTECLPAATRTMFRNGHIYHGQHRNKRGEVF